MAKTIKATVKLLQSSVERLAQATLMPQDKLWYKFMRRETSILLKRAWSLWWLVRFSRKSKEVKNDRN